MRRPNPKNRRHAGPTTRASDTSFLKADEGLLNSNTVRSVAAKSGVSHVTIIAWRKHAQAAVREIGMYNILRNGKAYRDMFVKNGVELASILNVSKKAIKGLEIILRSWELLEGSRVDNIVGALRKSRKPLQRRVLRRKFHLSNTEVTRLMHKLGWNNAKR